MRRTINIDKIEKVENNLLEQSLRAILKELSSRAQKVQGEGADFTDKNREDYGRLRYRFWEEMRGRFATRPLREDVYENPK